ncbi:MAG: Choloylglycine hydrolase [Gammaproteobacteria bacterium]|nr:Choloylglycine hydrolase [Gammaproteobacteria bacterium]
MINKKRLPLLTFIAAFLFIQPIANACTGIMLKNKDNSIVTGRTVEFGITIDSSVAVVPRNYSFVGQTPMGKGMQYSSKYAAVGVIAYKDLNLLDGLNEKGLAVGVFYFPTFAQYTTETTQNQNKALSPGDFPNWLLTQFATVAEVRRAIEKDQAVITPTIMPGWGNEAPPFHYIVYDKTGASIAIEPLDGKLVVRNNPLGVFTNSPSFDWHMTNLRNYISLNTHNVPEITLNGVNFKELGQGNGMLGLPGDFTPPSRFVRATIFSTAATPAKNADEGIQQTFHILNNFDIPVGVAREESNDVTQTDYTLLTMARDLENLRYYYKSYDDQTIRMVQLKHFDLNAKTIKTLSTKGKQPVVDMSDQLQ